MSDKLILNIIGNTFTYMHSGNKGYSVHQKEAKNLGWTQDGTGEGSVYIDRAINRDLTFEYEGPRYAWVYESREVVPGPNRDMMNNTRWYLDNFDMIFAHNKDLLDLDEKFKFVPACGTWIDEPQMCEKTKLISMITSHKQMTSGHKTRFSWANKLSGELDLYGRDFNPIEKKEEGLCDYMFSVAMENGKYSSYFTEKILDCFATGTIPVYWGTPDIDDFFNMDGIIIMTPSFDISSLNEDLYESMRPAAEDNLNRLMEDYIIPEDYMYKHHLS